MEAETEVKTVEVNLKCPDCDMVMKFDGTPWKFDTGQYIYKCRRCETTTTVGKKYPYIKHFPK